MAFLFPQGVNYSGPECVQNSHISNYEAIVLVLGMADVFIVTNVAEGMKVKLMRISKGLRQIDVAAAARVDCIDIIRLEKDRYVLPMRRKRILAVLGLLDDEGACDDQ